MEKIVLAVHLLTAFAIIGLILLQRGKGAEAGASFGAGASQTLFGSAGSWNFFSKTTAILATVFFATSFALAVIAKNSAGIDTEILPAMELLQEQDLEVEPGTIPQIDEDSTSELPGIPEIPAFEGSGAEIPLIPAAPVLPEVDPTLGDADAVNKE